LYFDTHTHYEDKRFNDDRDELLGSMQLNGVSLILNVAYSLRSAKFGIELAEKYPFVYASVGVHPHDSKSMTDETVTQLEELLKHPKAVAVGEIGLDFHYDHSPRDAQRAAFEAQLSLALELGKPVIIHIREAHGEAIDIMSARHKTGRLPRGVMHCYTGSLESARLYINMGMYISLSGAVTFKNAPKLWEAAKHIPLERLLIETDCPYMAPVPMRGQRNEPAFVKYIAEKIAALRGIPAEALAVASFKNGKELFNIDEDTL